MKCAVSGSQESSGQAGKQRKWTKKRDGKFYIFVKLYALIPRLHESSSRMRTDKTIAAQKKKTLGHFRA